MKEKPKSSKLLTKLDGGKSWGKNKMFISKLGVKLSEYL